MSKRTTRTKTPFVLGRDIFAKIAAVEGRVTTKELIEDFRGFYVASLSHAERSRRLIQKYGKR